MNSEQLKRPGEYKKIIIESVCSEAVKLVTDVTTEGAVHSSWYPEALGGRDAMHTVV